MLSQYLFYGLLLTGFAFVCSFAATVRLGFALAAPACRPLPRTHRRFATATIVTLLLFACATEAFVRLGGGTPPDQRLFWAHLPFALIVTGALFALRFRLTGRRYPRGHRALAYWLLLPAFAGMSVTGIMLLLPIARQLL